MNMAIRLNRQLKYWLLFSCFVLAAMNICSHYYKIMKINQNRSVITEQKAIKDVPSIPKIRIKKANDQQISDEITVVTAYWNLGKFRKASRYFDTKLYHHWAKAFKYIMNPLVVYTDSSEFSDLMKSLRNSTQHRTQIHLVNRTSSWAFRNINRIKEIFSTPGYPKHYPNTVLPEYACAQHAKYDVTVRAAKENNYRTKYFAWIDIGYFRNRKSSKPFHLKSPDGFNESRIAMNEVNKKGRHSTTRIFKSNIVWIGGGLFHGRYDVIIKFGAQFRRAVEYFISKGLMNSDQQVIYAMLTEEGHKNIHTGNIQEIDIQRYGHKADWFFLGKHMVRELN